MTILAIETSCDETSVAIVRDGKDILSNVLLSQERVHGRFGGVVPELASRQHLEVLDDLVIKAVKKASVGWKEIRGIAVTYGPGLIGALLVGVSYAKALAYALDIPLLGVNHLEGHLFAPLFEYPEIKFPTVALIVSGGHTHLFLVKKVGIYKLLGKTRDDAAGEALDKGARMMGLGFPGGPILDQLSSQGGTPKIDFPRAYLGPDSLDFSFSGVKTALRDYLGKNVYSKEELENQLPDLASSFLQAVVDVLVEKGLQAAKRSGVSQIVVGGGVSANSLLRKQMFQKGSEERIDPFFPSPFLSTDNAGMVGLVGCYLFQKGIYSSFDLNPKANLSLSEENLAF
ncbi:MAG TPA: tRNA (adenosine(37)-N6)-threonylcarbamoyltransferase complex transferase subunit TsaD [Nitrospiria bacterium]|jgi:N6-L-threonylcarbamoyladenine synthase